MTNPEPMTPKRFSKIIEDIVLDKAITHMDAILYIVKIMNLNQKM